MSLLPPYEQFGNIYRELIEFSVICVKVNDEYKIAFYMPCYLYEYIIV